MSQKLTAAIVGTAALVLAVAIISNTVDPAPSDVKTLAAGLAPPYAIFKLARSDGGSVYAGVSTGDAGCTTDPKLGTTCMTADVITYLDHSPCRKRPKGVKVSDCSKPDGGDSGDENVAQSGGLSGIGCVEVPCVVVYGDKAP
jgi:hypothetical protein